MVRKNILIVAPYGFVDRLTNYIEFIAARHLVKNEWSVTAIVQSLDTNRSSTDSVSGIRVFRYGTLLAGAFLFCRYLLSGRPDIVHVHNLRNNRLAFGVAMVTKYILRRPLVFTEYGLLHDHYLTDDRDNPLEHQIKTDNLIKNVADISRRLWRAKGRGAIDVLKNYFFHWPLTHADTVVFVSKHNVPIAKMLGLKNILYLPYFIDTNRWSYSDVDFDDKSKIQHTIASQKLDTLVNTKNVLFIGQLKLRKGWDVLLRAIPFIPPDVVSRFVFITNSAYEEPDEFASLVNVLKVRSRLLFLGKVDSKILKRAYETCAVVAVPSHYEGFGLPVLEAFDMGKPVVASAVDAITDNVTNEQNGLLVPPGDPKKLAEAITRVFRDESLYKRLALGGKTTIKQLQSPENSNAWLDFYNSLLHP